MLGDAHRQKFGDSCSADHDRGLDRFRCCIEAAARVHVASPGLLLGLAQFGGERHDDGAQPVHGVALLCTRTGVPEMGLALIQWTHTQIGRRVRLKDQVLGGSIYL